MRRRPALAGCLACALLQAGCAGLPWPFSGANERMGVTQEDLDIRLASYVARFAAAVTSTSEEIGSQAKERQVRKRALLWRMQMPRYMQDGVANTSPLAGYANAVAIATSQHAYLTDGDGKSLFGPLQPLAVETAAALTHDALAIGADFLTPAQQRDLETRTMEIAARFPIRGRDFTPPALSADEVTAHTTDALGWLVSLPLAPFRALEGVDAGAQSIAAFNQTARDFSLIIAQLPEQLRGQLELFLYDVEDRETLVRGLDAVESAAASAALASEAVARLPQDVQRLLADSGSTAQTLGRAVVDARALAPTLAETATRLEEASAAWLSVLGPADTPKDPGSRPFDVREWMATATAIGDAAGEMRALSTSIAALTSDERALGSALDGLFWRLAALILLFFATLLLYRVLAARLARPQ